MKKFCLLILAICATASIHLSQAQENSSKEQDESSGYSYVEEFFEVPLDHFSFARKETFKIKYLLNDTFWDREGNGPIFFYTGNEGAIEGFAENTGFMWDIAEEFGACVIFAEHRFYGASSPPESLKYKLEERNIKIMGYLTVQQALADFAQLITSFKKDNDADLSSVIAFGGSYGGVLTAWMRMKYPHIVAGGIASSAPFYLQNVPCETYDATLAAIFARSSDNCVTAIRESWGVLNDLGKTAKGQKWISKTWKLCDPIAKSEDIETLKSWLENMYGFMGMANYPYPANFLQDLPAHPIDAFCSHLKGTNVSSHKELMRDMQKSINVYINNTGSTFCFDYSEDSLYSETFSSSDDTSFSYQSCTELIDPSCDDGAHDFFEQSSWDFEEFSQNCFNDYHVRPQPNLTDLYFGGKDIIAASNIVFSNGLLDPWFAYGVLGNISETLLAVVIPDAAHHLDLRGANDADPPSVLVAREFEKGQIRKWIAEYQNNMEKIKNAFANF